MIHHGIFWLAKNLSELRRLWTLDVDYGFEHHGITLCTGSLGANPENDLVEFIHKLGHRVHFVHFRNVGYLGEKHLQRQRIIRRWEIWICAPLWEALVEVGFENPIRPDPWSGDLGASLLVRVMVCMTGRLGLPICKVCMEMTSSWETEKSIGSFPSLIELYRGLKLRGLDRLDWSKPLFFPEEPIICLGLWPAKVPKDSYG